MKKLLAYKSKVTQGILANDRNFPFVVSQLINQTVKQSKHQVECIYVDVTNFASMDNKTGIQRVVREVIYGLLQDERFKHKIKFIVATKKIGYRLVEFEVKDNTIAFFRDKVTKNTPLINLTKNDVYLGLDFTPNVVPEHFFSFLKWRLSGAQLIWILYDLLPLQQPKWFTPATQDTYLPWLKTLFLLSTDILCISKAVQQEVKDYAYNLGLTPKVSHIELGYGFRTDIVREPLPSINRSLKEQLPVQKFALMVGTLEPRKGHLEIVKAFHQLWDSQRLDIPLVLVGKQGWNIDELKEIISNSNYLDEKLFWLEKTNDEDLSWLYSRAKGVIVASYGEGYGLPLIEAILHHRHVLARDLTVFREVASNSENVTFFTSDRVEDCATAIDHWVKSQWSQLLIINKDSFVDSDWSRSLNCIYNAIYR